LGVEVEPNNIPSSNPYLRVQLDPDEGSSFWDKGVTKRALEQIVKELFNYNNIYINSANGESKKYLQKMIYI
jgi:hypothetical protein